MKATELIGKLAIRTSHVTYAHGNICRSFMEEPIRIIKATDRHIVYEWVNHPSFNDKPNILSYEYCDDNWINYEELIADINIKTDVSVKKENPKPDFKVGDWVRVLNTGGCHNSYFTFFKPNNLDQFAGKFRSGESPAVGVAYKIVAIGEYEGKYNNYYGPLYLIESSDGQVYIMNNNHKELKLTDPPKPEPKFQIGDKVVPVSKSVNGPLSASGQWEIANKEKNQPFLYVTIQNYSDLGYKGIIVCHENKDSCSGDYFLESDLIPYIEPKPEVKPEPVKDKLFKVGDRVKSIGEIGKGFIGTVKQVMRVDCVVEFDNCHTGFNIPGYRPNYACIKNFSNIELLLPQSINQCPEPKTLTSSTSFIFNGNKTTCIIEIDSRKFKGCAKCDPGDEWNEEVGKQWAELRANRKMIDAVERDLKKQ